MTFLLQQQWCQVVLIVVILLSFLISLEDSPIGSGLEDEDVSDCSAGDGSSSGEDLEDNARSNISTEEQQL